MERRSGPVLRGWPLFIIVVSALPLILICGSTGAWFFLLPALQGGERWQTANGSCPILVTSVASRLGVAADAEPNVLGIPDGKLKTSLCRYGAAGGGSEAANLEVAVKVAGAGQFEDAHEQALAAVDEKKKSLGAIGEQRKDQIFGAPQLSPERLEMVTVVDNAAVEIRYGYAEDRAVEDSAKDAIRDSLQAVTDQAVTNLG